MLIVALRAEGHVPSHWHGTPSSHQLTVRRQNAFNGSRRPPSTPRAGPLGPRARSANSCALRKATTPGPALGGTTSRPARMRGRWTDSKSSRARSLLTTVRAAAGAPHDALRHGCRTATAAAAPTPPGHHRELGGLRGRGQHRAGSLLRAGADRGCGFKALPADLWPGVCQAAGPKCPGAARATAPGAGRDVST